MAGKSPNCKLSFHDSGIDDKKREFLISREGLQSEADPKFHGAIEYDAGSVVVLCDRDGFCVLTSKGFMDWVSCSDHEREVYLEDTKPVPFVQNLYMQDQIVEIGVSFMDELSRI